MAEAEPPATIPALLGKMVAERGAHPAVVTARETVSYAELDRRSARLASALLAAGAGKGARIALLAPDGVFWLTAFLGSLRIGALLTPVSTLCAPPELAHILAHGDCQYLIAARRLLNHDYGATLEAALPGLKGQPAGRLRLREAPYLRTIWLDDPGDFGWAKPIAELEALADAGDAPDRALLAAIEAEVSPADAAVVVYTSGSTARPKAVVHRHWAMARHSPELARNFALTPQDRMMCLLPAFWLAGMSMVTQMLSIGATLVYPDSPTIDDALAAIAHLGVTRVNAWGDRQPQLTRAAQARGLDLSHIPDLAGFRDRDGRPLPDKIAMYGMTESYSAHSAHPLGVPLPAGKEAAFGRAIDGYERRVVDTATGAELPPGEVGELQIRGPAMLAGFYKADRTDVFTRDGFYPTRDLVRIDADGWLYPAGRLDDMIKTRGANVSRLEVEAALAALPGVETAIVAGLPDAELGKVIVAAVVPETGAELHEETLRAALRDSLSSFKIPRRIVFITADAIPRTATGKVKLAETAAMIEAHDPPL
jgi:acyl-CoA synthetase (AMP-forming)/AMP-acid ligase II